MATALLLFAAMASRFAITPVDVTIKVAVLSGVDVKPVALRKFTISGGAGDAPVRTNEQGVIAMSLEPGKYKLRSVEALNLGNTSVEWDYGFEVIDGKPLNLVITNEDGISKKVEAPVAPAGNGVAPETLIYRKYKNSTATVLTESGSGSAFLIDSSGLFLTNAHVVEGSKKFRVKLGSGKVYKAELAQMRGNLDVAILRVNPEAVKDIPTISLLAADDKQPEEGERVIAMGSPLNQQNVMTTGIVSKVEKEVLISDVNINHGNSGGPLLDVQGRAIGICTFGDTTKNGPGISGIISIKVARDLVADVKSNIVAIQTPPATELPDFLDIKFQPTSIDPATVKKPMDAAVLKFPRLFKTLIDTPIWRLSRQLDYDRRNSKKMRGGKESLPTRTLKFWEQYAGGTNYTLVSFSAIPLSAETNGSALSHALFGKLAGKSKMEVRFDFRDMEILADGQVIEPVEFYRFHDVIDAENDEAYISDTYTTGYFTYRFDSFIPGKKYKLRVRKEEDPKKWDETDIDPKLIKKIYDSFADVRKFLNSGS